MRRSFPPPSYHELSASPPRGLVALMASPHLHSMSSDALLRKILALPAEERMRLLEQIWDSLAANESDVPVPDWHIAELDRRLADPDERATLTWDQVKEGLNRKR